MTEWTSFMKDKNIKHILMLLDDNELDDYPEPGLVKLYEHAGFRVHHEPLLVAGAPNRIFDIIQQAESNGERVVAHCTHGMGRSGRVSAAWLVNRYGLSPEEATNEVMEQAETASLVRLGNPTKLCEWLEHILIKRVMNLLKGFRIIASYKSRILVYQFASHSNDV